MLRRILIAAPFLVLPGIAHADLNCADNFLSGTAKGVIDAATGVPIAILPYAGTGYVGNGYDYAIDLGGGGYAYGKPVDPLPPPPPPGFTDDLALAPNDAGATRLVFPGDGTARLTGPNTDVTFQSVDPTGLFVDGDLVARGGTGIVNGRPTTAVPDAGGVTLRLGSGFNITRTRGVRARFADGTVLDTVVRAGGPPPATGFTGDLVLEPNALGATRIVFAGDGTARLTGPGTDVLFTGVDASALAFDGPVVALAGSGTVGGTVATAVPLPGQPRGAVLTLDSGFNPTGARTLRASFSTGAVLQATILRPAS